MNVSGASSADGAAIIQWLSTGGTNQEWEIIAL
jgi:alpha-L-fucosidase